MSIETKGLPQIPWKTERTKVVQATDQYVRLQNGTLRVDIGVTGSTIFTRNSRDDIKEWMEKDQILTNAFLEWQEEQSFRSWAKEREAWIRERSSVPPGVKEWRPASKAGSGMEIGVLGSGNTTNEDSQYWWGSVFEYTHFGMDDATFFNTEGLIVMWHEGGDVRGNYSTPEVWVGSVAEFWDNQRESDPDSIETLVGYNSLFENGILWALDYLGCFENTDEGYLPDWAIVAIGVDPDLLWPELVDKLLAIEDLERPDFKEFPEKITTAVGVWMDRRRRRIEKTTGQKYLWPKLYPGKKRRG